ncbi:MAG: hypothetical protein ACI837_002359 [Crocinitomicaceae bacterium]|jgi:hypothetical protein
MFKIILMGALFLTNIFNSLATNVSYDEDPCNRIQIEFLHDFEMVGKVREEVAAPVEEYFKKKAEIENVSISVMGNFAIINLSYKHDHVTLETVQEVYKEVQHLMSKGKIPKYVEGPFIRGCGISLPAGGRGDKGKVYKSLEEALKTPDKVYMLDIAYPPISELPESIGLLKNLVWLELNDNNLVSLPDAICELKDLKVLNLSDNKLRSLPVNFGNLTNLTTLILEDNMLKALPESMKRLSKLEKLNIRGNKFAELPDLIGAFKSLTFIDLARNELTTFPGSIGKLKQLNFLNACSNNLEILPREMGELKSLATIYLSDNELSELPESMGKLSNLTELYMEAGRTSEEDEAQIRKLLPKCEVRF